MGGALVKPSNSSRKSVKPSPSLNLDGSLTSLEESISTQEERIVPQQVSITTQRDKLPKGVSVHHLKHVLLEEVKRTPGLSGRCNIYDIENWSSPECGIIRRKGQSVVDTQGRMGASYVDSLCGEDDVGPANVVLSYTWRYPIEDIVQTLLEFCRTQKRHLKRTYVWICFL